MARINTDILGISKLKWTGIGKFNSDGHDIYHCGKNPLEEIEYPLESTKESERQFFGSISKMTE